MNKPSILQDLYGDATDYVDNNTMEYAITKIIARSKCLSEGIYSAMMRAKDINYPNPASIYVGRGENLTFKNLRNGTFRIFYQTDETTMITECDGECFDRIVKHL